jgi:hypothetical protein
MAIPPASRHQSREYQIDNFNNGRRDTAAAWGIELAPQCWQASEANDAVLLLDPAA